MANHIQVIKAFMSEARGDYSTFNCNIGNIQEIKSQINKIEDVLQKTSKVKYCDNYMLDIAIEQKIRELEKVNITTYSDIRLKNIENMECEEFCFIFWILTDNIAQFMSPGEKINIKIHNRYEIPESGKVGIAFKIEGYTTNIKRRKISRNYSMYIAKRLLDKADGTVVNIMEKDRITEVGMCELKRRNG